MFDIFLLISFHLFKLDLHRHGLSKPALQGIVDTQKNKWPTSTLGRFTQKTTKATMRAALLNRELGFTIHTSESEPVQSHPPEGHDEGQVRGIPNENPSQTMAAASTEQTVQGAVIDSNKPGTFMLESPAFPSLIDSPQSRTIQVMNSR